MPSCRDGHLRGFGFLWAEYRFPHSGPSISSASIFFYQDILLQLSSGSGRERDFNIK